MRQSETARIDFWSARLHLPQPSQHCSPRCFATITLDAVNRVAAGSSADALQRRRWIERERSAGEALVTGLGRGVFDGRLPGR